MGGAGTAGYDSGFWIRGGDFSLRINLTIQARYETFIWDDTEEPGAPNVAFPIGAGDLSGFSVPRTTLKFSGTAPCSMRYYVELEHDSAVLSALLRSIGQYRYAKAPFRIRK